MRTHTVQLTPRTETQLTPGSSSYTGNPRQDPSPFLPQSMRVVNIVLAVLMAATFQPSTHDWLQSTREQRFPIYHKSQQTSNQIPGHAPVTPCHSSFTSP